MMNLKMNLKLLSILILSLIAINLYSLQGPTQKGILVDAYSNILKETIVDRVGNIQEIPYTAGIQVHFIRGIPPIVFGGFGIDLNYHHAYSITLNNSVQKITYLKPLATIKLSYLLNLQIGLGPAFGIEDASGVKFAFMISGGIYLPITEKIFFDLNFRRDWITSSNGLSTFSVMGGLSYFFEI